MASNPFYIGGDPGGEYSKSFISEVRISSTARSDAWIKATAHSLKNTLLTIGEEQPSTVDGWAYCRAIEIDDSKIDASLTNFPARIILRGTNFDFANAAEFGQDIRFSTDSTMSNSLSFERLRHDQVTEKAEYEVKIPAISDTEPTRFYIFYGNEDAMDAEDAENVWDDNFAAVLHMGEYQTLTATSNIDMGQGDPFATQVRTSGNDILVPYMTWADTGDKFRMDLNIARFSSGMTLQETVTKTGVWSHDWDAGYPKPDEWHAAFMPQYHQNFFGVVDFTDAGYAPIWCDVSPWLLNENGVRSYYQQSDRVYYVADTLLFFEELPILRSTYPDGCHVAPAGLNDGRYRFFGFDARGEIGFWSWKPGDDAPVEKTIETGWMSNYSTTAIFATPGGVFGALFWDVFSRKLRFMRSSAANARVVDQVALKVTTSSDPINTIQSPIDTDDAFMSLYASGQRAWFGLEMTGNYSVRGLGSSSVYEEHDFIPYPFRREGIRMDLNSLEKQTKVILPDTEARDIREMVRAGTDFRGKRCILRRLLGGADPMDAGSVITLIDGYIQDWATNSEQGLVTFTVTHSSVDARNPFPPRLLSLNCGHKFTGTRCQYLGETGFCDHTKPTCQALNNLLRFGGFEHVAARQRRVLWR